jgi:putative tryptophan/tyrosine transport system substrate-binding protein
MICISCARGPLDGVGEALARATSKTSQVVWDLAFASLAERRPGGVVIPTNAFFLGARQRIVELAANYKIAAIYDVREFAEAGGLISYGQSTDRFRQVGFYVGKILRGAQPADLPVVQPSKLELVINLKAQNQSDSPCHRRWWHKPTGSSNETQAPRTSCR